MNKLMSRLVLRAALTVCLLLLIQSVGYADAVPDGFIQVPWGASREQIIKTMKERGYRQLTGTVPSQVAFRGAFAGANCQLSFSLIADSFYKGRAEACNRSDYPMSPRATYRRTVDMLSEKYGPPQHHKSGAHKANTDGRELPYAHAVWNLVNSRTSDKFTIRVNFNVTWFAGDGKGDQYVVDIEYSAGSLEERLKMKEY